MMLESDQASSWPGYQSSAGVMCHWSGNHRPTMWQPKSPIFCGTWKRWVSRFFHNRGLSCPLHFRRGYVPWLPMRVSSAGCTEQVKGVDLKDVMLGHGLPVRALPNG